MLVLMGGLEVNKKLQPLNAEGAPIEGLYATGNVQGGRYLVEYPVTVAGISLGTALTFGRLAGMNAAGADIEATTQAEPNRLPSPREGSHDGSLLLLYGTVAFESGLFERSKTSSVRCAISRCRRRTGGRARRRGAWRGPARAGCSGRRDTDGTAPP